VSNAIRYDSLLVRELARELHVSLSGGRIDDVFFDRERLRLTLRMRPFRRGHDGPPSLLWQLHPSSGHLTPAPEGAGAGRARLPAGARVAAVSAPPDERILVVDIDADNDTPGTLRRIIVELVTNQWNACGLGADGRILALLRERRSAGRELRAGIRWTPLPSSGRPGSTGPLGRDEWVAALATVPAGERLRALPRLVAYTSPQNAGWIAGEADVTDSVAALERARDRYVRLVWGEPPQPVLLEERGGWQPYVAAASGGEAMPTLLHAFAEAAARASAAPTAAEVVEQAVSALAERLEALNRRERRLRQEQSGAAEEAERLRRSADLLLSQLHIVSRGAASVDLDDWAGSRIEVELDPSLSPSDNATRLYDEARRRDRAAARIPKLLHAVERQRRRLEALGTRIREGAATDDELARLQPQRRTAGREAPTSLPYRLYRTSGGLEVRVGRGSRANDELTFRHSSPNDVWLHARDVAGAHVILRWARADANPPARDLAEAAVLAALHSRARTSGTVPVDWTRRKYVRKPRKAGPGLVLPDRVRTLFVEPDAELESRLREDSDV
jgi:predicted ribosome quality control (RQC) complex YloA/Tae2 family protein